MTDFFQEKLLISSLLPLNFYFTFSSFFSVLKTSHVSHATASPQAGKTYEAHNIHHTLYIHVVQFIPAIHFEVNIIIHSFCFTLNKCLFSAV